MTRRTNARVAGAAFLVYIVAGISAESLSGRAGSGAPMPAALARLAEHAAAMRAAVVLDLVGAFCAIVLAVTLHALTRDEDRDLAMLGLACRVGEGVLGAFPFTMLGLLWLATASGPGAPDAATARTLGAFLQRVETWQATTCAILFAVGSTLFAWLLLRGRIVPAPLSRLGVAASVLLVAALPLRLVGLLHGLAAWLVWMPMLAFELALAAWLLARGAAAPAAAPG